MPSPIDCYWLLGALWEESWGWVCLPQERGSHLIGTGCHWCGLWVWEWGWFQSLILSDSSTEAKTIRFIRINSTFPNLDGSSPLLNSLLWMCSSFSSLHFSHDPNVHLLAILSSVKFSIRLWGTLWSLSTPPMPIIPLRSSMHPLYSG